MLETFIQMGFLSSILLESFIIPFSYVYSLEDWNPKVPTKVSSFLWTAALGRILANDNLLKHQIVVIDWCCMCCKARETCNHLLLSWQRVVKRNAYTLWDLLDYAQWGH